MAYKKREQHGDSKKRLYAIWHDMRYRCNSKKCKSYKWYGEDGISVCEEWENSYLLFKEWSLKNGYNDTLTIDRINKGLGYSPSNCRYVSWNVQRRNTRVLNCRNTSGYRGVFWNNQKNKWQSRIVIENKQKHLGFFVDIIDAAKAYDNYIFINGLEHTMNGIMDLNVDKYKIK